jgi:hypothetical protein
VTPTTIAFPRRGAVRRASSTIPVQGHRVIIEPNSPSVGVTVAFIEVNGAPVELLQIDHAARPDL